MDKPQRRYASLSDFRKQHCRNDAQRADGTFWPCLLCGGRGWYYDPADHDPIEGYKMADRHPCRAGCDKGRGSKAKCREAYLAHQKMHKAAMTEWNKRRKLLRAAAAKLSNDERAVLGL